MLGLYVHVCMFIMIATRGLKPAVFIVGERVLCFEPDPTKVRVLYDSKILKVDWTRDDAGKRVPEYLVHFNGWNHSWDRWAPENFILKYTDENLELQDKLQKEAEEKMRKKRRKRTWSEILEEAKERREKMAKENSASSEGTSSSGDISDSEAESDDNETVEVPISFPEALRAKLEDDCYFITSKKQLVKLPPDHTVLGVMETYLKDFAYRCRMHNVRVHARQQGTAGMPPSLTAAQANNGDSVVPPPQPQFNVDLCREVMDGLRILFDFLLPTNLLYSCERAQYASLYPEPPSQANGVKEEPSGKPRIYANGNVRLTRRHSISPSKESPPILEPQTGSPTSELPPVLKPETLGEEGKEEAKEEEKEKEPPPARRVTRRSSASNFNQSPPPPVVTRELRSSDSHRRKSVDNKHSSSSSSSSGAAKPDDQHEATKRDRHPHHPHTRESSGSHQPATRSLRHSARLASHSSSSTLSPSHTPTSSPPVITNMEGIPALEASTPAAAAGGGAGDSGRHGNTRDAGSHRNSTRTETVMVMRSRGRPRADVGKIPQTGECSIKQEDTGAVEDGMVSIEKNCWKLLREEANYNGAEPPCRVYGAQHLLRLFVKLPEILGGMDLHPKKLKPLVKHVEMFLRWLSATDQLLEYFPDKAYISASDANPGSSTTKTRRAFAAK